MKVSAFKFPSGVEALTVYNTSGYVTILPFKGQQIWELIYSAPYDKEHITVHKIISLSATKEKAQKLLAFMDAVQENPVLHHKVGDPNALFDPEICMTVRYKADEKGRAYTMQYKKGEDAMGMILPATSEHLGRNYAKRKGTMRVLQPHEKTVFTIETGWMNDSEASALADKIEKINK